MRYLVCLSLAHSFNLPLPLSLFLEGRPEDEEILRHLQEPSLLSLVMESALHHADVGVVTSSLRLLVHLICACRLPSTKTPQLLLSQFSSIHHSSMNILHILTSAVDGTAAADMTILLEDHFYSNLISNSTNSNTPLHIASARGNLQIVASLINHGADVNKPVRDGGTPLLLALTNGHLDTLAFLLKHGADVNRPVNGFTPLHHAIMQDKLEIVQLLIKHGANVNTMNKDHTPLIVAVLQQNQSILHHLLLNGANVNIQTSDGFTALMYAVLLGKPNLVQEILDYGHPDISIRNADGKTALTLTNNSEINQLLSKTVTPQNSQTNSS